MGGDGMRVRVFLVCLLVGLGCGCSGGGLSNKERSTIETIIRTPNDKATADSIRFSDWDSTTLEESGKQWKVVRVKYSGKKGGSGEAFTKDRLYRYEGEPLMPLEEAENT